jgi:hypothetical protein
MSDFSIASYVQGNASSETDAPKIRKKSTPWIPRADADLAHLGMYAAEKMKSSGLTLRLFTADELKQESVDYKSSFVTADIKKSERTPASQRITELNAEIKINIEHPKNYLYEVYGSKRTNYYAAIGVEKTSQGYKISTDRQKCVVALEKLIAYAQANNWDNRIYNAAYWQGILDEYRSLAALCSNSAGDISKTAGNKNTRKPALVTKLQCVMHLVRANFPENPEAELRAWGFQRETF